MGGMLPTVGTGREASPSPRGAGRRRVQGAGRAGRERRRKRAGSSPARHSQRITRQPNRNPGQAKRVPSLGSPSPQRHAAQAPRQHRGSAERFIFTNYRGTFPFARTTLN